MVDPAYAGAADYYHRADCSEIIVHPEENAAAVGISLTTPLASTIARIGFGAFPLGCSIFILSCLVSRKRILTGLGFVSIMLGVALAVRIFGVLVDGTFQQSIRLIGAETVMLVLSIAGVLIESSRVRINNEAQNIALA